MAEVREHVADGIEEYDNPLPRWWVHLFIGSIVFAVVYSVLYPSLWFWNGALNWSSSRQHAQEVADARTTYDAAAEAASAKIDLEQLSKDPVAIAEGQVIFGQFCAPCHGARGEGGIGLRLYGPTWKWGGDSRSMLTTIRFGRPPSVMPAWGKQMPLEKISRVGAFVYSLRYTAPQGPSGAAPSPATAPAGPSPVTAPAGASPGTAPTGASPVIAPEGASPGTAPSGASPDTAPAGASPGTAPSGASPDTAPAGASPAAAHAPAVPAANPAAGATPPSTAPGAPPPPAASAASPAATAIPLTP